MTLEEMHEQRQTMPSASRRPPPRGSRRTASNSKASRSSTSTRPISSSSTARTRFDAEGLTQLTETIEARRRMRNEIEQRTQIEIRTQNLEAQRQALDIERDSEYARLAQEHDIEIRRAAQRVELARDRAVRERESRAGADRRARGGREVATPPGAKPRRSAHPEPGGDRTSRDRAAPLDRRGARCSRASKPNASRSRLSSRWRRRASNATASSSELEVQRRRALEAGRNQPPDRRRREELRN